MSIKKAKKKEAPKTARGNTYVLTASGKKELAERGGQAELVRDALAKHGPITSAGILDKVGDKINKDLTVAAKNIAFYLCTWKSDGYVKFGPKNAGKKAASKAEEA